MEPNKTNAEQESVFKSMIFPVIVLVAICVVCSALLAVLNSQTAPIIEANTRAETMQAYLSVLPQGTDEASLTEIEGLTTPGVEGAVQTADGAVAIKASYAGYSGKAVTVYVAFDTAGSITNAVVDASTQTAGIGSKTGEESFYGGFVGWNAEKWVSDGDPVDAIAGATISSKAAFNAINAAIDCFSNEIKGVA